MKSSKEIAKKWDVAERTVTAFCNSGKIPGDINWENLAMAYGYSDPAELRTLKFTITDPADPTISDDFTLEQVLHDEAYTVGSESGNLQSKIMVEAFTANKYTPTGSSLLRFDTTTGKFVSINGSDSAQLMLSQVQPAGRFSDITINFSATTMYNNGESSTISAASGDNAKLGSGRKLGEMSGVSIQDDGRIYASYSNGMSKLLGQIAVAEFANASGLEKEGDNLYKSTQNSGDFDGIGVEVKSGGGYMTTGVLEMSNVDLSAEFTDMITTQRGFQANSRIITVSDTLLEELVNLKR